LGLVEASSNTSNLLSVAAIIVSVGVEELLYLGPSSQYQAVACSVSTHQRNVINMASPPPLNNGCNSSPTPDYGSVNDDNDKLNTTTSNGPIHLHPTLDSLDVGPHAFRPSNSASPMPQDGHVFTQLRRNLSHSSSPRPSALTSPFLRKFSPSPDVLADTEGLTLPQAYDSSLNTPFLEDDGGDNKSNVAVEQVKNNESENVCKNSVSHTVHTFAQLL
jgi:hypothetical protein